jgi:hypothetical protein
MRKWLAPVTAVAIILIGALVWFVPFVSRSRQPVSSTGASPPFSNVTPVRLPASSVLCMTDVTIGTDARIAQFTVIPGASPAPPLRVSANGPDGYHSPEVDVPGGQRNAGPQTASIRPPTHPVIGEICVRNAGRVAISLVGTTENRTSGRERAVIDGEPIRPDVQLALLERDSRTMLQDAPEVLQHMAAFKGSFVSSGLLWVLLLLVVLGVPVLVVAAVAEATTDGRGAPAPPATKHRRERL